MNREIRITVLIENTSDGSLACEHGFSLLIAHAGRRILLDAGSTDAFCANADALGISLTHLDACVLSHGHYDHSGGFHELFLRDPTAKVYAQRGRWTLISPAATGCMKSACRRGWRPSGVDSF